MKLSSLLYVGLAVITAAIAFSQLRARTNSRFIPIKHIQQFTEWRQTHGKLYATPSEADYRLQIFSGQLDFIDESNNQYNEAITAQGKELSGPMFEMNHFGDLTQEEFSARYTGGKPSNQEYIEQANPDYDNESESSDLIEEQRILGQTPFVPKIRQQGSCGSCWAFSTIVEVERSYFAQTGKVIDLSQQELVDCDKQNGGCDGGWPEYAFDYIKANGIHTSSDYPYRGARTNCQKSKPGAIPFTSYGISAWTPWSASYSAKLSQKQIYPSVGIFSSGKFRYLGKPDDEFDAKLSGDCSKSMDHLVAQRWFVNGVASIVNSWGTGWGVGGFKKIKPCSDNSLLGKNGRIAHPWRQITP